MTTSTSRSKTCRTCGAVKPLDGFHKNRKSRDGRLNHCRTCHNAKKRESGPKQRWASPEARRAAHLRRAYGLSVEDYAALHESQSGCCAICDTADRKLFVDHDHESGAVRGLLCSPCNRALGGLGDCADGVRRALAYLEAA